MAGVKNINTDETTSLVTETILRNLFDLFMLPCFKRIIRCEKNNHRCFFSNDSLITRFIIFRQPTTQYQLSRRLDFIHATEFCCAWRIV